MVLYVLCEDPVPPYNWRLQSRSASNGSKRPGKGRDLLSHECHITTTTFQMKDVSYSQLLRKLRMKALTTRKLTHRLCHSCHHTQQP